MSIPTTSLPLLLVRGSSTNKLLLQRLSGDVEWYTGQGNANETGKFRVGCVAPLVIRTSLDNMILSITPETVSRRRGKKGEGGL